MSHTVIKLDNISKTYGNNLVLSNLSLQLSDGQFVIIFGESGVGKSTLLNIIALIDNPTSGEYCLNEEKVNFRSEKQLSLLRNTKLGIVFQMYYLIPKLTVQENILSPFLYRRESFFKEYKQLYIELINRLKLESICDRPVDVLSGGEKQRVAIARALITNPPVIICDEPTGNLDDKNTETIMLALQEATKSGKTVIMVSHNRALKKFADKSYELTKEGLQEI